MDRVEQARARSHAHRLRWQRAWATAGFGMLAVGVGISSLHPCAFVYGAYAFVIGPAVLFLSVLPASQPTQTVSIRLIVPTAMLLLGCYHGVHLDTAPLRVNTIHAYAMTMFVVHTIYVVYAWRVHAWRRRDSRRAAAYQRNTGGRSPGDALLLSTHVYRNAMLCYVPVGIIWGVAIRYDNTPCAMPNQWWLRLVSHGGLSVTAMGMCVLLRPWWSNAVQVVLARRSEGAFVAGSISEAMIACDDERRAWQSIEKRMRDARRTFRGVNIALLTLLHLSPLSDDESSQAYALSRPAMVGLVDAFVSHSWQDDSAEKWRVLQQWRDAFKQRHKREPTIWIDRCCIDPTTAYFKDILNYIPIYLAGCRTLIVLNGPTYTSRLWCVIELYVFHELRLHDSQVDVLTFGRHTVSAGDDAFDVRNAVCTYAPDATRLRRVLRLHCHMEAFNAWVRVLLASDEYQGA